MRVATFYGSIHTSRPRTRRSVTSDMRRHRKTHTYLCGNNNGVRGSFSWLMKCVRMNSDRVIFAPSIGEFKGPRGLFLPPNLAPNKFQDRPSGASRMQENLLVNGAPPRSRWGNYSTPQTPILVGRELSASSPRTLTPLLIRRVYDSRHLQADRLPRTGISSGTLRSAIEYGLPLPF